MLTLYLITPPCPGGVSPDLTENPAQRGDNVTLSPVPQG